MSFDPDIWGTVSDWTMIVVTAVTGLLLYLTLTAQLRVTRIEQYRHKLNIQPRLTAKIENVRTEKNDEKYEAIIFLRLTVENHRCLPLKFELVERDKLVNTHKELHSDYLGVGEEIIHFPILSIFPEPKENILKGIYIAAAELYFYFLDADRRTYKQEIQITIYHGEKIIHHRDPIEIKD